MARGYIYLLLWIYLLQNKLTKTRKLIRLFEIINIEIYIGTRMELVFWKGMVCQYNLITVTMIFETTQKLKSLFSLASGFEIYT